jgi:hypothetical protein
MEHFIGYYAFGMAIVAVWMINFLIEERELRPDDEVEFADVAISVMLVLVWPVFVAAAVADIVIWFREGR